MIDNAGRKIIAQRNGLGAGRGDFFFSTQEVKNEMEQVNRLVDSLGVDVNQQRARLPPQVYRGFVQFWGEWKTFYKDRNTWLSRHGRSTYEKVLEYREQAANWQNRIAKAGAELAALPLPKGGQDPDQTKNMIKWGIIGVVGLVGLVIAGKLIRSIMLGNAELGEAEEAAMAIADAARRKRSARSVLSIA